MGYVPNDYYKDYDFAYIVFVLGYDLLHDRFEECFDAPCDLACEICVEVAREFIRMDRCDPMDCSEYEALQVWLENNWDFVEYQFTRHGMSHRKEA